MKKFFAIISPLYYGKMLNLKVIFSPEKTAVKAFYIFSKVRKGRLNTTQKEYLNPFKYKIISCQNHKIQTYKWSGTKETVLLIHGWESNTWRWHKLIEKLTLSNYNIIAFDAPGHGASSGEYLYVPLYAQVVQNLIDTFKPKHLIGHSVGGMTILFNQHKNSNTLIEKIVTIGAPSEFHEIIANYQNILGFNTKVYKAFERYIKSRFGFTIREFSTSNFVKSNSKKGLLFHDRLDKIAPYHASVAVHNNWKNSVLISTEGLGHSMHQEEINEQILAFLES